MRFNCFRILWSLLPAGVIAVPAFAFSPVTIVSVAPGAAGGPAIDASQFLMETWTSTVAFTNVTVSAFVYSENAANTAATAYLTTQTGAGSSSATLVAQTDLTLPVGTGGTTPELQLFSGLTLPPGQYYLIVATSDTSRNEVWLNGDLPAAPVTATGVTFNGPGQSTGGGTINSGYPPASTFPGTYAVGYAFDVTGVALADAGVVGTVIPQVVDGADWQSTLGVSNTSKLTAHAALQFFQTTDAAGDTAPWTLPTVEGTDLSDITLAPGATVYVHTPETSTTLTQGFGELVASPGVQAFAIFTLHVPGRQNQDGTAPAAYPGWDIFVPFDNSPGFTTSIAVVNASDAAEVLNVNIVLTSGDTITSSLPSIPAHGHAAFALVTQFPELAGQQGTLELTSQAEITGATTRQPAPRVIPQPMFSVIGLRFNPTGAFTSIPVYGAYTIVD